MKNMITFILAVLVSATSIQAQYTIKPHLPPNTIQRFAADLVVTKIKLPFVPSASRVYSGRLIPMKVNVTIKNIGSQITRNSSYFHTVVKFAGRGTFSEPIVRLRPGQSITLKIGILVPANLNGRYISFSSVVDYDDHVSESNERNNSRKARLKLPLYQRLNYKAR